MDKIVILLSTYNGEKYLDKQLESIYQQKTDIQIELLIRDDGSSDRTKEVINQWKSKMNITVLVDEKNLGAARSFWTLLKNAPDADYYAFVDQDDIWYSNKLSCAIKQLDKCGIPKMWFSNCDIIDKNGEKKKETVHSNNPVLTIPSQLICGSAQGCSMVFNRLAFDIIRDVELNYIPMHDIVVMLIILIYGVVEYDEQTYFAYRVHENNVVAKQGKNVITRVKSTVDLWFGKKNKCVISNLAHEILSKYKDDLTEENQKYLEDLTSCRKNLNSRFRIIKSPYTESSKSKALFSFKMRVLLGII